MDVLSTKYLLALLLYMGGALIALLGQCVSVALFAWNGQVTLSVWTIQIGIVLYVVGVIWRSDNPPKSLAHKGVEQ